MTGTPTFSPRTIAIAAAPAPCVETIGATSDTLPVEIAV